MAAPVPVFAMVGIVGRGIIGAGAERAAEKKQDQFPFPEAAWTRRPRCIPLIESSDATNPESP